MGIDGHLAQQIGRFGQSGIELHRADNDTTLTNTALNQIPEGIRVAEQTMKRQNEGVLSAYLEAAKVTASDCGAAVCDVYRKWQGLAAAGVDTTNLLANYINHPSRCMNYLAAHALVECMLGID